MEIMDIKNQYVKLSKGSVTVKGENGKTKGLVRGLTRFLDLQANKKIDYSKLLRNSGVWGNSKINMDNCYILDGTVYLIRNMNSYKYYTEEEKEKYDTMYQNIASYGIIVIPCYFVKEGNENSLIFLQKSIDKLSSLCYTKIVIKGRQHKKRSYRIGK